MWLEYVVKPFRLVRHSLIGEGGKEGNIFFCLSLLCGSDNNPLGGMVSVIPS